MKGSRVFTEFHALYCGVCVSCGKRHFEFWAAILPTKAKPIVGPMQFANGASQSDENSALKMATRNPEWCVREVVCILEKNKENFRVSFKLHGSGRPDTQAGKCAFSRGIMTKKLLAAATEGTHINFAAFIARTY